VRTIIARLHTTAPPSLIVLASNSPTARAALADKKVDMRLGDVAETWPGADYVVLCTGFSGFELPTLPEVIWEGERVDLRASFDPWTGLLAAERLFGLGIGFPQYWRDPEGHEEPKVGFGTSVLPHIEKFFG